MTKFLASISVVNWLRALALGMALAGTTQLVMLWQQQQSIQADMDRGGDAAFELAYALEREFSRFQNTLMRPFMESDGADAKALVERATLLRTRVMITRQSPGMASLLSEPGNATLLTQLQELGEVIEAEGPGLVASPDRLRAVVLRSQSLARGLER